MSASTFAKTPGTYLGSPDEGEETLSRNLAMSTLPRSCRVPVPGSQECVGSVSVLRRGQTQVSLGGLS